MPLMHKGLNYAGVITNSERLEFLNWRTLLARLRNKTRRSQSRSFEPMKSLTCLLLVTSFAAGATEEKSYSDRLDVDSAGNRIVVRSSAMPDARGGTRYVEQRLDQVDATTYVYDPSIQTEATQKYHEEFCAQHGMKPSLDGESIISGAVSGWGCHLPRNENERIDEGSMAVDGVVGKSSDYVFTTAPSGSVPSETFLHTEELKPEAA